MKAIVIVGRARAGKDTAAAFLARQTGMTWEATSEYFLANPYRRMMRRRWSREELAERHPKTWRQTLADAIEDYNDSDFTGCRLYREMVVDQKRGIINGIRRLRELEACVADGLVSEVWWIEADERLRNEPPDHTLDYGLRQLQESAWPLVVLGNNHEPEAMKRQILQEVERMQQ